MSAVRMTPARLELLRAVERGDVVHQPESVSPAYDVLAAIGQPDRAVTGALRPLIAGRLVTRPTDALRVTTWELADAGRAVLTEADKATPEPSGISQIEADAIEMAGVPPEFLGRVLDAESEDQS